MSDFQIWSEVQVDVQSALAAPVAITGITKANPAVVAAPDHDFTAGDIVLLRVKGMGDLDYAVVRVATVIADTSFVAEGIDATDMNGTFVSGSATKITFGVSANTFTDVTPSGGETSDVLIQTIHMKRGFNKPGAESPLVYGFGSLWDVADPALLALQAGARKGRVLAVRFKFLDGTTVLFAGLPSASMAPGGSAGGAVTTPVKINVRGWLQAYSGA
jgi:hypothetical protein